MKILLVDDSKSARYALRLQLQHHGIEVETAASAESALELLKGELPDAVLMDDMMPGLNGCEAIEIIRSDERTARIPVVLCTSHEDPDLAATAYRKGVLAILPKSVAQEILPEVLAKLEVAIAQGPTRFPVPPPTESAGASRTAADPDLLHQIESRVDEHIETRLSHLLEPLWLDLHRDLRERLMAETQQLVESRIAETHMGRPVQLAADGQATLARLDEQLQLLRASLARSYFAALGAALIGVAAAAVAYLLPR